MWLGEEATALLTVSLISVWQFVSIPMILIYTAMSLPLAIFILSEFIAQIPKDLKEAARCDGLTEYNIFFHIIPPLLRPGFIGSPAMNFLAGSARAEGGVDLGPAGSLSVDVPRSVAEGEKLTLGIRPEHLSVRAGEGAGLSATVDLVERLGEMGFAHLRLPTGQVVIAEIRGETDLRPGGRASLLPQPPHIHLFDASGSRIA